MINRLPQPDKPDDDVDRLLAEALQCDSPRPLFREQLARQLGEAYANSQSGRLVVESDASTEDHELMPSVGAAPVRRPSRLWTWGVAAAAMMIACSWWLSSPKYSWASMIAALEEAEWVGVATSQKGDEKSTVTNVWFSDLRQVSAVRDSQRVYFVDHREGVELSCTAVGDLVAADSVHYRAVASSNPPAADRRFVCAVLNSLDRKAIDRRQPAKQVDAQANDSTSRFVELKDIAFEVTDESWSRRNDGSVTLKVQLDLEKPNAQRLHLHVDVDSKTQLPQQARVAPTARAIEQEHADGNRILRFSYPAASPPVLSNLTEASQAIIAKSDSQLDQGRDQVAGLAGAVIRAGEPVKQSNLPTMSAAGEFPSPSKPVSDARGESDTSARIASARPELKPIHDTAARSIEPVAKQELPAAREMKEMTARIDEILANHWRTNSVTTVESAGDAEFMRRCYLDLTGRIPTVSEAREFLSDERTERREYLLDELTDSYDHASHLATVWRTFLLIETADIEALGGIGEFEAWLTKRFRDNQPYDKLVTDLLLAEGRVKSSGPLMFYAAAKLRPEELARQTSRAFLGMRLECAQCHDDFFDDSWKQEDFWAYAAFFARISQPEGRIERVSPVMRVRDITRGEAKLPDSDDVVAPRYPMADADLNAADDISRRQLLAAWLTSPDNPHFARATVNRVWAQLFGRGIVDPVDDMRVANPPICPELLDELSTYFVRTGFDLRRLISTIARSRAYQLSSTSGEDEPSRRIHFAQMNVKCLTAEQLYDCMSVATGVDAATGNLVGDNGLRRVNNFSRQAFIERFSVPPGNSTQYQAGIAQALTLMNGPLTHRATQQSSGLLGSLKADFFSDEQRVETLFLATLSRYPTPAERDTVVSFLNEAKDDQERAQSLSDALWALLNSAEFTLIH